MNKTIKKLFISVLSFVFAVLLFGTVSYAWFSIATTNVVYDIGLGITADNNFEISLDGINYYQRLTKEEIIKVVGDNLKLSDVTSHDGINFSKGFLFEEEIPLKNVDYLSLTLYFRTITSYEVDVYLVDNVSRDAYLNKDIDGTFLISKGSNWKSDTTFTYGPNPLTDVIEIEERHVFYSAEAVRIGFVEKKNENNINDQRTEADLNTIIFDLSRDPSRGYGANYGSLDYVNNKLKTNYEPPTTTQNVVTELTAFDEFNPYVPLDKNSFILKMIKTNEYDLKGNSFYKGSVELNIWLEGWDADCFDAIHYDPLTIQLKFKGSRKIINEY